MAGSKCVPSSEGSGLGPRLGRSSALWGSLFPECAGERRSTEAAVWAYRKVSGQAQIVHGVPARQLRAVSDLALPEPFPPAPPAPEATRPVPSILCPRI